MYIPLHHGVLSESLALFPRADYHQHQKDAASCNDVVLLFLLQLLGAAKFVRCFSGVLLYVESWFVLVRSFSEVIEPVWDAPFQAVYLMNYAMKQNK